MLSWPELTQQLRQIVDGVIRFVKARRHEEALLALAASSATDGHAYNVASGTGTAMADLAALVIELAGAGQVAHVEWPPLAAQIETGDFVADIARIHREIGWAPRVALREGLVQTVAHYRRLAP